MKGWLVIVLAAVVLVSGCASVSTEKGPETQARKTLKQQGFTFPLYSGVKKRIQVVRFGVPADIANKYPELADKRVGWGLCNRIVDGLWQTSMFEFIEEKEEILKKMLDQWELSSTGLVAEETVIEAGSLKAPEYLVYAEVFDFGVSHSEQIVGVTAKQVDTTVIGVQIRMVDVATGQYIPASATGEAKTTGVGIWASVNLEFDQTTVGMASQDAVNEALITLINRLKK